MTKDKLRIGVAGLGRIGWKFHCARLAEHPDFILAAVADTDSERLTEAHAAYGCAGFSAFDEMLAQAGLDAVVIATPTHFHESMALAAFACGLHVLLEKPMALDYAQAERIVREAEKTDRVLTVYQPHRLNAYFQHLKALVESGCIGRLTRVQRGSFSYSRRNDWQSLLAYGGGMLSNYGAHFLDQVLQLIGYDLRRVFCSLQRVASLGDADDVVDVALEAADGVIGSLQISQASVLRPYEFLLWGTHGGIALVANRFTVRSFDPAALPGKALDPSLGSLDRKYPSDALNLHEEVIPVDAARGIDVFANFAAAVRNGEDLAAPPRQTLKLMAVLEQCRESAAGIRVLQGMY
jgi:predicted dehydrogenase